MTPIPLNSAPEHGSLNQPPVRYFLAPQWNEMVKEKSKRGDGNRKAKVNVKERAKIRVIITKREEGKR